MQILYIFREREREKERDREREDRFDIYSYLSWSSSEGLLSVSFLTPLSHEIRRWGTLSA